MSKPLQSYLPSVLLTTCEFPLLCQSEQPEFDMLVTSVAEVLDAQFVTTASLRGIERYEKIFGLIAKDSDTLEERRFAVLSKMNAQSPYTVRSLKRMLTALCGEDAYSLEIDHDQYKLLVKLPVQEAQKLQAVRDMLHIVVPANMVCLVVTRLMRETQAVTRLAAAGVWAKHYGQYEVKL